MMIWMLTAGLAAFGLALVVGWFAVSRKAATVDAAPMRQGALATVSWIASLTGSVLLVVVGAYALSTGPMTIDVTGTVGGRAIEVDRLTGLFLIISFGVAVPAVLSAMSSTIATRGRLPAGVAAVLLATAIAILAGNLFVLIAGWEGLGFAFYLVVGFDRDRTARARSSILASVFSKASGAALVLGALLLYAETHSFSLASFAHASAGPGRDAAWALLVLGFGVKVGMVPVHLWLPSGYAAAPGPARAILAGVAVNVGFYGLWRIMDVLGAPPTWLACVVLVLAGVTAVLGISHATVHADLAYLVAWSSVENAGIILAGFGVAMVGDIIRAVPLMAVGLLAATAQVCAHALGKSLLFVSTSAIEEAYGTTDLDVLRGVAPRLRFSGTGLVVGALTLAGVPLTAGFASEWLILEALMQQFRVDNLALDLCLAVAGVLVALTIGIASIAFVRVIALTAFGPREKLTPAHAGETVERSWTHRAGIVLLVLGCLGVAAAAPLEVQLIATGISPLVGTAALSAVRQSVILQPVYGNFSALSPTLLWIVIPAYALIIAALATLLSARRFTRVRRVPVWTSGSPGVEGGHGYTSFAFANPIRKVLAAVLLTRSELRREEVATGGQVGNEDKGAKAATLGYTVDVVDIIERFLYRPLLPVGRAIVRTAKRLQSGRLDAYMAYMLVALLAVIAVVTALASM
ncbi:MAG TPA: proton-conducting transporter membrane subunit [Galbitalea sp.]|jgi:formate hydrogenlyase subunit 3/multisubunit Na+/H+ antiporter MnhD subunit|nr:proton-conducting transporter membrane subunit [Galbitalea sp.]